MTLNPKLHILLKTINKQTNARENCVIVQTPDQFLSDFIKHVRKAKKRIVMQTMYFKSGGGLSNKIVQALSSAAGQGISVNLGVDNYINEFPDTNLQMIPKPLRWLSNKARTQKEENECMYNFLQKQGVNIKFTNRAPLRSAFIPFAGRVHSKFVVIDNISWILEFNLDEKKDFSWINSAAQFTNPRIANILAEYGYKIFTDKHFIDYSVEINKQYAIFIDAGIPNNSIIRDEALSMIKNAVHDIKFASQYPPSGAIKKALIKKAQQGLSITFFTSQKVEKSLLLKDFSKESNINIIFNPKIVHSKALLVDSDELTDKGIILFGSNNLNYVGIVVGTGELAIKSTDMLFVQQINNFFYQYIQ